MLFHVLKQVFFIFADKKTKRPASLRFKCFHNGIILIVNCLKSFTKLRLFFHSAKFIPYLADILLHSAAVHCCFSIISKRSFGVLGGFGFF